MEDLLKPDGKDLSGEAVADEEPVPLEQQAGGGDEIGLGFGDVPGVESRNRPVLDLTDGAVAGVGNIDGPVVRHGDALGTLEA